MAKTANAVNATEANFTTMTKKLSDLTTAAVMECDRFSKEGIKKAGGAARKYLQEIKKAAQELRIMVQEKRNQDRK